MVHQVGLLRESLVNRWRAGTWAACRVTGPVGVLGFAPQRGAPAVRWAAGRLRGRRHAVSRSDTASAGDVAGLRNLASVRASPRELCRDPSQCLPAPQTPLALGGAAAWAPCSETLGPASWSHGAPRLFRASPRAACGRQCHDKPRAPCLAALGLAPVHARCPGMAGSPPGPRAEDGRALVPTGLVQPRHLNS